MKTKILIIVPVILIIIIVGVYTLFTPQANQPKIIPPENEVTDTTPVQTAPVLPVKNTDLKLGELGTFNTISIRPLSIEEDSRCPIDVTCIQAGTVRLKIQVVSGTNTNTSIVKLGQEFTTEGVKITLTDVNPRTNSKINISEKDYRFNFSVIKQDVPIVNDPKGKCYIGGCSGQICSDKEGMASTCEYREEYACYKTAICERQSSGECNWTQTLQLNTCLKK